MEKIILDIGHTSYPLYIEDDSLKFVGERIKAKYPNSKIVLLSDEKVFSIYGEEVISYLEIAGLEVEKIILPQGEGTKSLEMLCPLYEKLVQMNMSRTDVLVALGGGVIGDLTGFLASTYLRGVPYIQIPTTLLSQIDSSVGGKTAVNLPSGKNLVGAFYHPSMVLIDPQVLKTLDDETFAGGMAEVIKTALIRDKGLFKTLKDHSGRENIQPYMVKVILRCCKSKIQVVQMDERDTGIRQTLNFGHTLAHSLEKNPNIKIAHGQAVAIGMAIITKASEKMKLTKEGTYKEIVAILDEYDLPYIACDIDEDKMLETASHDKKMLNNTLNLILIKDIGDCFIYPIKIQKLREFL